MRTPLRFLLPLTLVVAAPFLGLGGSARAGYLAPVFAFSRHAGVIPDGIARADFDYGASTSDESAPDANLPYDNSDPPGPAYGPAFAGLIHTSFAPGAGSPTPSVDSGPGSSGPLPGIVAHPETDAPALAGAVFLKAAGRMPPPFPSRLFRPPRCL